MNQILYFVVIAAAFLVMSRFVPGVHVSGWGPALIAAVVLGLLNVIVKPILFVLTLPFTIVTLGLFLFVLNAIVIGLTAWLVPGFDLAGFVPALLVSIVISLVGMVWKSATKD